MESNLAFIFKPWKGWSRWLELAHMVSWEPPQVWSSLHLDSWPKLDLNVQDASSQSAIIQEINFGIPYGKKGLRVGDDDILRLPMTCVTFLSCKNLFGIFFLAKLSRYFSSFLADTCNQISSNVAIHSGSLWFHPMVLCFFFGWVLKFCPERLGRETHQQKWCLKEGIPLGFGVLCL